MINRVLQLNNSQLESSFNSHLEKHFKLDLQSQPNPNPIQSVIDRGNLRTQNVFFVDKGETSRSHEIDDKRLQEELGFSDRTGKLVKSEDIRVMHAHDGTGELVKSNASTHIVKEHFVPAEHRGIATCNADNEFNRATDEESI